jgi:hypothetical protein
MLSEEDIAAGRLKGYDVFYATDPCISHAAVAKIDQWVKTGGQLYGCCAAGSRNEFGEPVPGLADTFGIRGELQVNLQEGRYHVRGALNGLEYLDAIQLDPAAGLPALGALGAKVSIGAADGAHVLGAFGDGSPAVVTNTRGKGRTYYVGACPGLSYIKEARFVPAELKERWPDAHRRWINATAREAEVPRLVRLSHPVVEAGVYDAADGTALVLANFGYERIRSLQIALTVPRDVSSVRSLGQGPLSFAIRREAGSQAVTVDCQLDLGLTDVVLFE